MKATFAEFIAANKNCSGFENNRDAQRVFDFLNQDENIIAMIESADQDKPALSGCVLALDAFYEGLPNPAIDFNDNFTRTVVGRMIKSILAPFGYSPTHNKQLPRNVKGKYFMSASCYDQNDAATLSAATMHVVKMVEPISACDK